MRDFDSEIAQLQKDIGFGIFQGAKLNDDIAKLNNKIQEDVIKLSKLNDEKSALENAPKDPPPPAA